MPSPLVAEREARLVVAVGGVSDDGWRRTRRMEAEVEAEDAMRIYAAGDPAAATRANRGRPATKAEGEEGEGRSGSGSGSGRGGGQRDER